MSSSDYTDDGFPADCALCGCAEEEHDPNTGVCTGCGEECDFEEEDDVNREGEDDD